MKLFKKITLAILLLIALSCIGGYFYFDAKFSPPENYLSVSGTGLVRMKWEENHSALLLPVQLACDNRTYYMQFDTGSPSTIFYRKPMESIGIIGESKLISTRFSIGEMAVESKVFKLIDYGTAVDLNDAEAINIIGTIGTDLLEKRTIAMDFKQGICAFTETNLPETASDFEFKKRKILLPARIGGEDLKLLFDSGTSAYQLILNKSEWDKYRIPNSEVKIEKGNSWGNTLTVKSAAANKRIGFGKKEVDLTEVTHIEGTSKLQNLLMKCSGMQGMIGNTLFLDSKLTIDCGRRKFSVE